MQETNNSLADAIDDDSVISAAETAGQDEIYMEDITSASVDGNSSAVADGSETILGESSDGPLTGDPVASADDTEAATDLLKSTDLPESSADSDESAGAENLQEVVAVSDEPVPHSAGSFWFSLFGGILLGALLCLVLVSFLKHLRRAKHNWPRRAEGVTVQGLGKRENQQDTVYLSDPAGYPNDGLLFCVADGMGGLSNGAQISNAVVVAVADGFQTEARDNPDRLILSLVQKASQAANALVQPNYGSSGSTLVLGFLRDGLLTFASVGDSRICLCRDGKLYRLNRRHRFSDELYLASVNGEISFMQADTYDKKGALTSFMGMGPLKYLDLSDAGIPLQKGDTLIAMSDGVFNALSDTELISILQEKVTSLSRVLAESIEAKEKPYQDNYSAVMIRLS